MKGPTEAPTHCNRAESRRRLAASVPTASSCHRLRWRGPAIASVVLLVGAAAPLAQTPGYVDREHKIKAAYLYNLARYVQWPAEAFGDAKTPFVIGVLGADPIRPDLELIAQTKTVDGRPITLKQFEKPSDVAFCHILFMSPSVESAAQRKVIERLAGHHVLFVGQTAEFLEHGGVVDFVIRENKIRLVVAIEAAQREDLKISAKLLQVAQVVR